MKTSWSSRDEKGLKKLAQRRVAAGKLFEQGWRQAEVAREFRVSPETASRWYHLWHEGGLDALAACGRAGRRRRLSEEQLERLRDELVGGPEAHGYRTSLWTLSRIAKVIGELFGVRYSLSQVWKILQKLGFSCQKPSRQARQRNEREIEEWRKKAWPRIKRGPSGVERR